ncbi:putative spoU rRNA methylase [Mycobacterium kansasii 662]|uniref:Putative spoU rRNA methylase n=1 Tax=Mycobacterium kansasii 662 TaxID=1299326 RepID=X7XNN0_MYCKA|nr:putative spoU rRNA methylase [Mycobacterium kansasii 662]
MLRDGDTRNVVDAYRYWTREAIVADIDTRPALAACGDRELRHDANIGSVVRTANAFAVHTVHIVGVGRWNRRGAMVTDRYQRLRHPRQHRRAAGLRVWCRIDGGRRRQCPGCCGGWRRRRCRGSACCCSVRKGPGITADARAGASVTLSMPSSARPAASTPAWPPGSRDTCWIRQRMLTCPELDESEVGCLWLRVCGWACRRADPEP